MRLPVALTIAGSDSGGGAGIQADLKTFGAFGVHGTCAITAITAQNTVTVTAIEELSLAMITAQIDAVVGDLNPTAAKTGMLSSPEIIEAVAAAIRKHSLKQLVVDPVMVAKGGARLLREESVEALRSLLLPLAAVLTPNLPEAQVLLGRSVVTLAEREDAARDLLQLGPRAVVVKGGHAEGDAVDIFYDGTTMLHLSSPRFDTGNTHGSGCTFSAAITAGLARGLDVEAAVRAAKQFITEAIRDSLEIGHGHGPVNPLFAIKTPG